MSSDRSANDFPLARELDAHLARRPASASTRARTLARIRETHRPRRPRLRSTLVFASGALAAALVLIGLGTLQREPGPTTPVVAVDTDAPRQQPPPRIDAAPSATSCASRSGADGWILEGVCSLRLEDPALTIASVGTSKLRAEGHRITVDEGWIVFDVEPVDGPQPVQVAVATGVIEVLGTRFSVYQDERRGHVELVEGRIRFVDDHGGAAIVLEPGQRHGWERHGTPQPDAARDSEATDEPVEAQPQRRGPDGTQPTDPPEPPISRADDDAVASRPGSLDDIGRLRAKGQYAAALALIERLTDDAEDRRTREVLHYEAGTILDDALHDPRACAHWAEHRRRFADGRYHDEVQRRLEDCSE